MIDKHYTKSFWYFDDNDILLERLGWSDGKGDSAGRTAFAYICYPNESFLKDAILRCVKVRDDSYVQFYRYPDYGADTMSRDHVGAIILALYINRDFDELDFILDNLPWRLSRKYTQTIDFWLWSKTLFYRDKWHRWIWANSFILLTLVQFTLIVPWNFVIRTIIGAKKIDPTNFVYQKPAKWRRFLNKICYPQFALFLLAWQVKVLPKSIFKWLLQKLLSIESGNIVIDAVLGKKIDKIDYTPTTSFIWSRRLDNFDDILLRRMTDEESAHNDLNRCMIDYLYFGIDRIMLDSPDEIIRSIKTKNQIITY